MLIETKYGNLLWTEVQNTNGSLDNDSLLKKQILDEIKTMGFDWYKKIYGVLVQDFGYFKTDYTDNRNSERHGALFKMFDEDKELAKKHNRKLSIFLIKIV